MAKSRHFGAFAKGFADSFLAAYKLSMTRDLYEARSQYYRDRGYAAAHPGGKAGADAALQGVINQGKNDYLGGGGGGAATSKNLQANQNEAYQAARSEGLSDGSAKALVANMSGEALADPGNVHQDGPHMAHGIVQWDDQRAAAIQKQFGTAPQNMSVADQTKAAIWEMKTNPAYKGSWDALNSDASPQDKINTLVRNYERPGNPDKSIAQRVSALNSLPSSLGTTAVAAATPTKGPNKGKTPAATPPAAPATAGGDRVAATSTPYQVAGEAGDVTEAGAERAKADLAAHRVDPATAGAGTPPTGAPPPGTAIPRDLPSDQGPGPDPAQPPPGTESPGTQFARPEAPGVGGRGLPPAPAPGPVLGPAPRADTGARPDLVARSPGPPEARNMPSPGQTDPGGVYAPTSYARDTGARPDLTARSPAMAANVPAPNATPVSATAPRAIPAAPAQDPRFVQVSAPNANPNARNQPQMTALDLSHLWGPNPPVADRAPAPPGPPPPPPPVAMNPPMPPPRPRDLDNTPPPDTAIAGPDEVTAAAKGGPITRRVSGFAAGGGIPARPTMNLAAGGASSAYPSYTPAAPVAPKYGLSGNTLAADQYMTGLPGMGAVDLTQNVPGYYTSYGPGQGGAGGQALTSDWSKMTPDQLSQYNAMIAGTWTPPAATPAAAPAAAAPAPAPVGNPPSVQNITTYQGTPTDPSGVTTIDPTSTTTTGVPGVPTTGLQAATYDPNKIATTGSGSTTDATGGTNYTTDPNDDTKQILSAKGGAIPPLPTTRFAGAGAVSPNPVIAAMYAGTYNGPSSGGNWVGSTPYSALAPNQQAWADSQKNVWSQINAGGAQDAAYWGGGGRAPTGPVDTSQYLSQLSMMPDAVWPTAAPAAPTPIAQPAPTAQSIVDPSANLQSTIATIDPTSTTTTGTPGVPNTVKAAKSYDPNVDAQTGAGFADTDNTGGTNYDVGSNDYLNQTSPGQISGNNQNNTTVLSRKGGPITRRVSRYDDGGGVSPSIAGAPPGATGGGGAIPPVYYNPATYSAAGAPVGKGVTATSAPTFGAGAIPSLPMAQGGSVAFDDGGVAPAPTGGDPELQQMAYEDAQDGGTSAPAAPPTPTSDKDPDWYINPQQMASAAPPPAAAPPDHNAVPPDPTTPQIKDDQGNPSKGLIGAIGDGLHWLGDHLGIAGAQAAPAIAHDPQTQDARQKFVGNHPDGATYITHQNVEELNNVADPDHQLQGAYRNIAGLEAGYKWALSRGDDATAGRLAASILHYSVLTSQNLSAEAAKSLYKGDMHDAVDKLNQASDAVPDGRLVHATLNDDGTVTIQGKNLNGQVEWQKHGAAATVLEHATALGRSGKLQWDSLESQAAKYDSTFAQMQKARQGNATDAARENRQQEIWQHQQDVAEGKQTAKDKATSDAQAAEAAVLKGMAQPRVPGGTTPAVTPRVSPAIPPAPGATTASAPAAGAPPSGSGETAAATPPAGADSGAPTQGAIPSGPTAPTQTAQADMPSPQAQDASASQPPTRPDEVPGYEKLPPAQQNEVWKTYQAEYKDYADARNEERREGRMDRREATSQAAQTERERFSQESQNTRMKFDTDAKTLAAKTAEEHAARAPRPDADVHKMFALEPDASGKITGKQPADYFKDQAGLTDSGDIDPKLRDTQYLKEFPNRNDRTNMDNALVNGYRYSHDSTAPEIADALRGYVNGSYHADWQQVPEDGYGTRVAVAVTRPSDGSKATVVLPVRDWANIKGMASQRAQLAARGQADTAATSNNPYRPPPPATPPGQSVSIPGAIANWWQGGRGQAIPPGP